MAEYKREVQDLMYHYMVLVRRSTREIKDSICVHSKYEHWKARKRTGI